MNLYSYNDGVSKYYFIEDKNKELIPLSKKRDEEFFSKKENSYVIKTDEKYKGVLYYMFNDYPNIKKQAEKTEFDDEAMISLISNYHNEVCTTGEKCIIFQGKPDKHYVKTRFFVYGGLQINSLSSSYGSSVSDIISPVIGGRVDFSIPRWLNTMSAYVDLSFSLLKKEKPYTNEYYSGIFKIDTPILELNTGFAYTYPKGNFRPFLQAGFVPTFILSNSEQDIGTLYVGYHLGGGFKVKVANEIFLFIMADYIHRSVTVEYNEMQQEPRYKLKGTIIRAGFTF